MSDYPKKMVHPSYHKAQSQIFMVGNKIMGAQGEPDRLPPVWVNNPNQEAYERSCGYRAEGEAMSEATFQRYPMWMSKEKKNGQGHSDTEQVLVNDANEESVAVSKGFRAPNSNPAAYENAQADPPPDDYQPQEYPKYLGQDANGRDIIVESKEEETAYRKKEAAEIGAETEEYYQQRQVEERGLTKAEARNKRSERMKAAWAKRKAKAAEAQA